MPRGTTIDVQFPQHSSTLDVAESRIWMCWTLLFLDWQRLQQQNPPPLEDRDEEDDEDEDEDDHGGSDDEDKEDYPDDDTNTSNTCSVY
jgi:hypothetical protein